MSSAAASSPRPRRGTSRGSSACLRPVHGREKVARLLQAGAAQGERLGVVAMRLAEINGQPGALFLDDDDVAIAAVSLDIVDRQVQTLHAVSNPEKLEHLRAMVTGPG